MNLLDISCVFNLSLIATWNTPLIIFGLFENLFLDISYNNNLFLMEVWNTMLPKLLSFSWVFENNMFVSFGSLFNTHHIIEWGGLLLLLAIVYIETGFFLGFVLPGGDYLLFAAGMFCGTHYLEIPLPLLLFLLVTASFMGDFTGYFKGKWLGDKLFVDNKARFFKKEYLERGSSFYTRFGMWAFILGRFMPIIRTLVPMIAGASRYEFKKFLLFNLFGAITWVCTLVPLGYFIGKTYPGVMRYSIYILLIFVVVASLPMLKIMFSKMKKS